MRRPTLEVAYIFRVHGPAWREAQRGHLTLAQRKVMLAITRCRAAVLGGTVLRCEGCGTDSVSYKSFRNCHCPKCQSAAAQRWLDARQADLLPVAVPPRDIHAAGAHRQHRVHEQGRDLRAAVRCGRRGAADPRGRS